MKLAEPKLIPFVPPEHTCEPLRGGPYAGSSNHCPACAVQALVLWLEQEGFYRLPEDRSSVDYDFCVSGETWRVLTWVVLKGLKGLRKRQPGS